MYWNDHQPAHFHAKDGSLEALVDIEEGVVLNGALPVRQLKLVLAWAELHKGELLQNWEKCRQYEMPARIEALK